MVSALLLDDVPRSKLSLAFVDVNSIEYWHRGVALGVETGEATRTTMSPAATEAVPKPSRLGADEAEGADAGAEEGADVASP